MFLAVDIGGTKVGVARVTRQQGRLKVLDVARHASRDFPDLAALLAGFVGVADRPKAIGIGVAGPVLGRKVRLTNLPWEIDADSLERALGCPVALMNDLEAFGHGLDHVDDLVTLNRGEPRPGNRAIIAAGTGLGESIVFFDGRRYLPSASEGGHTGFSPRNADEIELLQFLMTRYEHVSWERVVSGLDGFRNLFDFLRTSGRITVPADFLARVGETRDIGEPLAAAKAAGEPFALEIYAWFVRLYGAEAANLALKAMSVGGLYVAGGIAPRILPELQSGAFMTAFTAKGRFRAMLAAMPVHVVTDPHTALKGAAAAAELAALG